MTIELRILQKQQVHIVQLGWGEGTLEGPVGEGEGEGVEIGEGTWQKCAHHHRVLTVTCEMAILTEHLEMF